jgi:16S rRNA C1402 N4-methylase RsmH
MSRVLRGARQNQKVKFLITRERMKMDEKKKKAVADVIANLISIESLANVIAEDVTNIAEAKRIARDIVKKAEHARKKLDKAFAPLGESSDTPNRT